MEIFEIDENSGDRENLNLSYAANANNDRSFNNVNVNVNANSSHEKQNKNQNIGLINDHICVNCSKLLVVPYYLSTQFSQDNLIQLQENGEADVEKHFTFEIEITENLDDVSDLPLPNDTAASANEKSKSVQRVQVKEILASIYSLNFLHLAASRTESKFLNDPNDPKRINSDITEANSGAVTVKQEDMCLCSGCADVLTNFYKYYTQFNQLRTFDSILSKKIHRLDEMLGVNPINYQNQQQVRRQSHCESHSFEGPVLQCEVSTEKGTYQTIFEEYDENRPFSAVQIELDENKSCQDVDSLQSDADRTASACSIIVHEYSSSGTLKAESSGPWVRLSRLRNVRFGNPVRLSNSNQVHQHQHESGNCDELPPEHGIELRKRRKIRKLNIQADDGCVDADLVFSGPSDNDNPNDSDFNIESDTLLSKKRKRKQFLGSSRKSQPTKNTVNPIEIPVLYIKTNAEIDATDETEENAETRKRAAKELTSYRRRKAHVPNPCWHCPLHFPTQEEVSAHTKATHFSAGDFFCLKCSKLCPNKKSYSQHRNICEKLCPGQKLAPWLCPHCGKTYPFKHYLDKHVKVHNAGDSFSCSSPFCTFKAKSQLLINLHFDRMHVEKPKFKVGEDGEPNLSEPIIHKCDLCQVTFKNDQSRRMHMHRTHSKEGSRKYRLRCDAVLARQKMERSLKGNSTVCPDCNIDFLTHLAFIGHRRTMHTLAPVCVCDECGKDFLRVKSLKRHKQSAHTHDRPFVCEQCGKTFKTSCNLRDHVSHTHTEEGRLKYNEFNRRRNQRKKIVAEALAKKTPTTTTSTSTIFDLRTI